MTFKERISKTRVLKQIFVIILDVFFSIVRVVSRVKVKQNDRIIIISLHRLGDTVFTIPSIKAFLKSQSSPVIIVCFQYSEAIYRKHLTSVEYLILNSEEFLYGGRIASRNARKKITEAKAFAIIDLVGSIVSASLIFNCRCNFIYGISENYFRKIYDKFIPLRNSPHQIDLYFDAIRAFSPEVKNTFTGVLSKQVNNGMILIHPFAGWSAKEWGFNNFILLYKLLAKKNSVSLIFPYGRINEDVISELLSQDIKFIITKSINHLFNFLENCCLFIANDSGPLQIAAMMGVPTFTIYGPTNPVFHIPPGKHHKYIRMELDCSPYTTKICIADGGESCGHRTCMKQLTVEAVSEEIEKYLMKMNEF